MKMHPFLNLCGRMLISVGAFLLFGAPSCSSQTPAVPFGESAVIDGDSGFGGEASDAPGSAASARWQESNLPSGKKLGGNGVGYEEPQYPFFVAFGLRTDEVPLLIFRFRELLEDGTEAIPVARYLVSDRAVSVFLERDHIFREYRAARPELVEGGINLSYTFLLCSGSHLGDPVLVVGDLTNGAATVHFPGGEALGIEGYSGRGVTPPRSPGEGFFLEVGPIRVTVSALGSVDEVPSGLLELRSEDRSSVNQSVPLECHLNFPRSRR